MLLLSWVIHTADGISNCFDVDELLMWLEMFVVTICTFNNVPYKWVMVALD